MFRCWSDGESEGSLPAAIDILSETTVDLRASLYIYTALLCGAALL